MKSPILIVILIGLVIFTTLIVLFGANIAHSHIYNQIWLADGNDTPECMKSYANTFACPHTDAEYYHGFYWSSHIMDIIIWSTGIILGVKLYRKKTNSITKKPFIIVAGLIVLVVLLIFSIGHFRTLNYYEGAYDFVMFDCFDERAPNPTLHATIVYQNDTHIIDNKNCQWEIRQ